jgi:hypothetical protein
VCSGHETSLHYFSCSGGTGTVSLKIAPGHVTPEVVFLHPVGSESHIMHSDAPGP